MRFLLICALALALGLAACGDDDDEPSTGATETTPAATETAATNDDTGSGGGGEVSIAMKDIQFDPAEATAAVGDTVTWTNEDSVEHDVDFTSGGDFESDLIGQGDTIEFQAEEAGTYEYVCSVHPNMTGTLTVE